MTAPRVEGRVVSCRPELTTENGGPDRLARHQKEGLYVYGMGRRSLQPRPAFTAGDEVAAVEHPRGGGTGRVLPGVVERVDGGWARVRYGTAGARVLGTGLDPYDAISGWRWDDRQRWCLRHASDEEGMT